MFVAWVKRTPQQQEKKKRLLQKSMFDTSRQSSTSRKFIGGGSLKDWFMVLLKYRSEALSFLQNFQNWERFRPLKLKQNLKISLMPCGVSVAQNIHRILIVTHLKQIISQNNCPVPVPVFGRYSLWKMHWELNAHYLKELLQKSRNQKCFRARETSWC